MSSPDVILEIQDGGTGIIAPSAAGVHVKMGHCTGGTANTLYGFSSKKVLLDTLGGGATVKAAAFALDRGATPVYVMPTAASVVGTVSAVVKTGAGAGVIATTGTTPNDSYDVKIVVVVGGAVGTATVKISLDGGDNFGPVTATAASMPITGTGIIVVPTNTFAAGDFYTFTTTAPSPNSSDLGTAFTALLLDSTTKWSFVHVVGLAAAPSGQATLATAIGSQMDAAKNANRFVWALVECPDDTDNNIKTAFASFTHERVVVAAGFEELIDSTTGLSDKRPAAWSVAPRVATVSLGTDPARFRDGALKGIVKLYRDEFKTPSLDDAKFTTLRTFEGQSGFFINQAKTMAGSTSDFRFLVLRRVMDRACEVTYAALLNYLNESLRVDKVTGFILKADADALDAEVTNILRADLLSNGHVSDVRFYVDRADNLISLQELQGEVEVIPLAYARNVRVKIGFKNPALVAVAE